MGRGEGIEGVCEEQRIRKWTGRGRKGEREKVEGRGTEKKWITEKEEEGRRKEKKVRVFKS